MTSKILFDAMNGLDSRFILNAVPSQEKHRAKNPLRKMGALAACLCLFVTISIGILLSSAPTDPPDGGDGGTIVDKVLPTDIDKIIWNEQIGSSGSTSPQPYQEWNRFFVDDALYEALLSCPKDKFIAITVTAKNGDSVNQAILDKTLNRDYRSGTLYIFATKEQLIDWDLENSGDYVFNLACRNDYENSLREGKTK